MTEKQKRKVVNYMCVEKQSINSNMADGKERSVSSILAYFVLFFCMLAIIYPLIIELSSKPAPIEVHLSVAPDTLPTQVIFDKSDIDSLFSIIQRQERLLSEKYDYVLEQKENEFKWQTYISFIIGIIVSICGFFGYKSLRELKEEVRAETKQQAETTAQGIARDVAESAARTTAEKVAQATAEETARSEAKEIAKKVSEEEVRQQLPKQSKEYLDEHLQKEVSNQMDALFKNDLYSALKVELKEYIDNKTVKRSRKKLDKALQEEDNEITLPSDNNAEIMFQNIK